LVFAALSGGLTLFVLVILDCGSALAHKMASLCAIFLALHGVGNILPDHGGNTCRVLRKWKEGKKREEWMCLRRFSAGTG